MMRIFRPAKLIALPVVLLVAACSALQPASPTPAGPTSTPSSTPVIRIVVSVGAPEKTIPPSWTPLPTKTAVPTATKLPTATAINTATPIPSATIIAGKPGILTTEGLLSVEISEDDANAAFSVTRNSVYFSTSISFPPTITFKDNGASLNLNFNDHSATGLVADMNLFLHPGGRELAANVINYTLKDGGQMTAQQTQIVRDMLRAAFDLMLRTQIKPIAPDLRTYRVLAVTVSPKHLLVGLQVTQATLSPNELTATATTSVTVPPATEAATTAK